LSAECQKRDRQGGLDAEEALPDGRASDTSSKIKSIDIALIENEWRAQTHFLINNFNFAKTPRAQLFVAPLKLTGA
jgi:hypothetical protein